MIASCVVTVFLVLVCCPKYHSKNRLSLPSMDSASSYKYNLNSLTFMSYYKEYDCFTSLYWSVNKWIMNKWFYSGAAKPPGPITPKALISSGDSN